MESTNAQARSERVFISRDAHRQPAPPVAPPALTRHLAFQRIDGIDLDKWHEAIDEHVQSTIERSMKYAFANGQTDLHKSIVISDLTKITSFSMRTDATSAIDMIGSRYDVSVSSGKVNFLFAGTRGGSYAGRLQYLAISGFWSGMVFRIAFENFDEYFTISLTVELTAAESARDSECSDEQSSYIAFVKSMNKKVDAMRAEPGLPGTDFYRPDPQFEDASRHLYGTVWEEFCRDLVGDFAPDLAAKIFEDLRGIVFHTDLTSQSAHIADMRHVSDAQRSVPSKIASLGHRRWFNDITRTDALVRGALMPLLAALDPVAHENLQLSRALHANEYSFSFLGEQRFIFGTSFTKFPAAKVDGDPNRYVLLACHENWQQIGRMVSRIHTLETLRLSALFDFSKLVDRDVVLSRLDKDLRDVDSLKRRYLHEEGDVSDSYDDFDRIRGESKPVFPGTDHKLEREKDALKAQPSPDRVKLSELRKELRNRQRFNAGDVSQLQQIILTQVRRAVWNMDGSIEGGISQRAFETRSARQMFISIAKSMRIERVMGYQPYYPFVVHRLERAYALIESIDTKFKTIFAKESHLRKLLHDDTALSHQKELNRLQAAAEFGFRFILAPYYFTHVVEFIVKPFYEEKTVDRICFVVVILVVLAASAQLLTNRLERYLRRFMSRG